MLRICSSAAEKEFEEYREYLLLETQNLTSFIAVYRQLQQMDGRRRKAMNYAPAFFGTTTTALFSVIVLWSTKLLDPKCERGYSDFLQFVGSRLDIFALQALQRRARLSGDDMKVRQPITQETIDEDRARLRSIAALPNLKLRRNKFHAHFDRAYFFDRAKIQQDAPLKWSDLEDVEKVLGQILNRYSLAYDAKGYILKLGNIRDLHHLLDRVRDPLVVLSPERPGRRRA